MNHNGYFSDFGGAFLPEILMATFDELTAAFKDAKADPNFWREYATLMSTYSCRPTPLTFAGNLTRHFGGAPTQVGPYRLALNALIAAGMPLLLTSPIVRPIVRRSKSITSASASNDQMNGTNAMKRGSARAIS